MSYTPDDQLLEVPLLKTCTALKDLQAPILERLRNPSDWNKAHLDELKVLLKDVIDMELRLRNLASEVR